MGMQRAGRIIRAAWRRQDRVDGPWSDVPDADSRAHRKTSPCMPQPATAAPWPTAHQPPAQAEGEAAVAVAVAEGAAAVGDWRPASGSAAPATDGSQTRNREPSPSVLSISIVPPC